MKLARIHLQAGAAVAVALATLSAGSAGARPTAPARQLADTLRVVQATAPSSLNPNIDNQRSSIRVIQMVTEPATKSVRQASGKYEPKPWLVTGWKQIDPLTWRFKVRRGVKFSNGEVLSAFAFSATWDQMVEYPGGKLPFLLSGVKDVKPVDKYTFDVITTAKNLVGTPDALTYFFILPPRYLAKVGPSGFGQAPVGTGPYKVTQFQSGVGLTFEANPNYWGPKAKIKNVTIRGVPDASTRVSDLISGAADLVENVPPILISRVKGASGYEARSTPTTVAFFAMFQVNKAPFNRPLVRKAFNYAIDRKVILKNLFQGYAAPLTQFWVPEVIGYKPGYDPYPYNPTKAKQLLAQAGYPDGVPIDFYYSSGSFLLDAQVCEAMQSMLTSVGFKVTMHSGSYSTMAATFRSGGVSGAFFNDYSPLTSDLDLILRVYFSKNSLYGKDVVSNQADALAKVAASTVNPKKRAAVYSKIQDIVLGKQSLVVPLYRQVDVWGASKKLNWKPQTNQFYDLEDASWK
jgi:peptide/nickel transport system substrate-binding protein